MVWPVLKLSLWAISALGLYSIVTNSENGDDGFIGPIFEPNPEPKTSFMDYLDLGFTGEKKGLFVLALSALILYSKPWK